MAFLNEIEKLKVIYRRNRTIDRVWFENSAEHSWHLALMAIVLCRRLFAVTALMAPARVIWRVNGRKRLSSVSSVPS